MADYVNVYLKFLIYMLLCWVFLLVYIVRKSNLVCISDIHFSEVKSS